MRWAVYGALDLQERIKNEERPWYVPPRRLMFIGDQHFLYVGQEFLALFRELGGLRPTDDVLDIGSGIGRMAVPLLEYLEPSARYEGFDVDKTGVAWCRREITPRHPNFKFQHADLQNARYSATGASPASTFRFPYDDASFDFAIATSVFTHLQSREARNYIRETMRVLRPGGRLFGTWFLLGADRERAGGAAGDEDAWFPDEHDGQRVVSRHVPEFAIAFPQHEIVDWHEEVGFTTPSLHLGSWLGGPGPTGQDIVVAAKS